MLSQEQLPQSLLPKCLDVLRELSASERDLILVCVEIVHELRDPKGEDEEEDLNVSAILYIC
jgi:condensin complex subunit 3